MNPEQILLTFADKETADYVRLICRRKGIALEAYIVDNFEWDDKPDCISDCNYRCILCEYNDKCPDSEEKMRA